MGRNKIAIIAVLVMIVSCLCFMLAVSGPRADVDRSQPTREAAPTASKAMIYDQCVQRCVNAAREANVERDDITDDDYQIIMAEHKKYICPGKCQSYK